MSDDDTDEIRRVDAFARAAVSSTSWCHLLVGSPFAEERVIFEDLGPVTRRVRGRKMRDWANLYDEFAAAWQFGEYFGENSWAFSECLGDLHDTWPTTTGFVVVVADAEQVLADEADADLGRPFQHLHGLVGILNSVAEWYAEPVPGTPEDVNARPAYSFDVVLVTDTEQRDRVRYLWQQAGAPLEG